MHGDWVACCRHLAMEERVQECRKVSNIDVAQTVMR